MSGRGWSYWSRNKLEILRDYLPAFNTAAKVKSPERVYIDLMAGQPENFDRDTGERFDGSARLALAAHPGFTRFAFGEKDPARAAALKADLMARHPGAPLMVYLGDCNATITQILADLSDLNWAPTFAFLDQQAAELHWETMARLAAFRRGKTKVEQWILWSPAMIAKGARGTNRVAFIDRVDRLYGSGTWRNILAARLDAEPITAAEFRAEMVNLLRWQLETQLNYKHTVRIPMRMKNKTDLYDMVFATDHEAGLKIMSHLYKKAAEREPKMREEAIATASGSFQESLFGDDGFRSVPEWKSESCWDPSDRTWFSG